eukprot:gene8661-11587_t
MFEWDEAKNRSNIAKHGVSFSFASKIFAGIVLTREDARNDYGELREVSIGLAEGVASHGLFQRVQRHARSENDMAKRYAKALSAEEIARIPDSSIDTSDIPALDDAFWSNAKLVQPDRTQSVTLRVR